VFVTQAAEGKQGQFRYFTTAMRWGELDPMLVFHDELGELDSDHRMQRGLAKARIGDLVRYVTEAPDHFFSSMTLIILPRDLSRPADEFDPGDADEEWDFAFSPSEGSGPGRQRLGELRLSGQVRLFPADGQHRAKAGREGLKKDHRLALEEVPVVLIPYGDADEVRQLFSDLNANAKPVSKTISYDFETRDPLAIIAKEVARDVPLFRDRVNRVTNSLPATSASVITLNTLVQGTRSIIKGLAIQASEMVDDDAKPADILKAYIAQGKSDEFKAIALEVSAVWEVIIDSFGTKWDAVHAGEDRAAGKLRDEYLFPHGLGWLALAQAAGQLIAEMGEGWEDAFRKAVGKFNWARSDDEWAGNAVLRKENGTNRVNNTGPAVKDLAQKIVEQAKA
jgi:DNA sulfur modification protein DndB